MLLFWVGCFGCVSILLLFCFWFLPTFYRVDLVLSLRTAASSSSSRRLPKSHTQHHTPNITHSTSHIQLEAKGGGRKLARGKKGKSRRSLPSCLPSFVSLYFHSGCSWLPLPALGCCLPSLSPLMISILGCSWLPLPALGCSLPPCLPSWFPFTMPLLGCFWLPLPPCLPSLFFFMISILDCSWLPLPRCLPSLSPFVISFLGCSWLLSPKLVSLHDLHSGLLLATAAALSPKLLSLYDFLSGLLALSCRCRLVSQAS